MSDIDNTRRCEASGEETPFADYTDSNSGKEIDSLYTRPLRFSHCENLHIDMDWTNNDLHAESRSYRLNKDTSNNIS